MAAPTFLQIIAGVTSRVSAAILGGAGSANQVVATNASGLIDISFFPAGIGADTVTVPASEAISAGAPVNLYPGTASGNPTTARNADSGSANAGKKLMGFALAAVASGNNVTVYRSGQDTALSGLTPGADYWLGPSGTFTSTPPSAVGTTTQYAGVAVNATTLDVQPGPPVANVS